MGEYFDNAWTFIGGARPVSPSATTAQTAETTVTAPAAAPAAAPVSNEPKPLPNQSMPTNIQSGTSVNNNPTVDLTKLIPLQTTVTDQTIAQGDKELLQDSLNKQNTAYDNQIAYIQNLGKLTKKASDEADKSLGTQQDAAKKYEETITTNREKLQADLREMDSQLENLKATQYKDFWADKSTAGKIGMAIAVGLGQYASTMTGTQNMAWNILQKAMDDDFRLQQANYDKQVKNIQELRIGMEQKHKLMDAATKEFEVYKVARANYIEDAINKALQEKGKLTPPLQEMKKKVELAKQAAYQQTLSTMVDRKVTQTASGMQQRPIDHKQAQADMSNEKTVLGNYNKAISDYNQIESFKGSKNYNSSVIKLVADGLKQGSYDPSKFDPTSRSAFQKLQDLGEKQLNSGEEQQIVESAEKYFELNALQAYKDVRSQLPSYWNASYQTSAQMGQNPVRDMYAKELPKTLLNKSADLSKTGMTKASQ
jgi:hypothetical protein